MKAIATDRRFVYQLHEYAREEGHTPAIRQGLIQQQYLCTCAYSPSHLDGRCGCWHATRSNSLHLPELGSLGMRCCDTAS